ncbi:MAG: hypothetical protein COA66_00075 [Arcobacter sp.]|nr:MAG: hypothetical protein COA66_00075 [Arcobacter sp.]
MYYSKCVIVLFILSFSGCIGPKAIVFSKPMIASYVYSDEVLIQKFKQCYKNNNRDILVENGIGKNYKKIRMYEKKNEYYNLISVITIMDVNNSRSVYSDEDINRNLQIKEWLNSNLECINVK